MNRSAGDWAAVLIVVLCCLGVYRLGEWGYELLKPLSGYRLHCEIVENPNAEG
jgi:hypothetical protein